MRRKSDTGAYVQLGRVEQTHHQNMSCILLVSLYKSTMIHKLLSKIMVDVRMLSLCMVTRALFTTSQQHLDPNIDERTFEPFENLDQQIRRSVCKMAEKVTEVTD